MIWSTSSREIVSMIARLSRQRLDQRLLDRAKPAVDLEGGDLGVLRVEGGELLLEILGHLELDAPRQSHVVDRSHPVSGLLGSELYPSAVVRQGVEEGLGEVLLGL